MIRSVQPLPAQMLAPLAQNKASRAVRAVFAAQSTKRYLQSKRWLMLIAFALFASLSISLPVSAANNTSAQSATETQIEESSDGQSATSSSQEDLSETTKNLRERIERIVEEKRDQIKGVLTEIDAVRRGTVGEIQRVTEDSITIRSRTGTEIIPLSNTLYPVTITKAGKTVKVSEIAVGNWLLALGVIEDDDFQPIRLQISEDSLRPATRSVAIGTLDEIERAAITISARDGSGQVTYTTNKNTIYQDISGEEITAQDLEVEMQVVAAGIISDEDDGSSTRIAKVVRILTTVADEK